MFAYGAGMEFAAELRQGQGRTNTRSPTEQLITKNPSVLSSLKQLKLRNVELITQLIKRPSRRD